MKALILCAGFGTRLYPLTRNFPKPLLRINNKTVLDYIIEKLISKKELEEIIILSNHKFIEIFRKWGRKQKSKKIKILDNLISEYRNRRGAIADLYFAIKKKKIKQDLIVIGGDNFFDSPLDDFIAFSEKHKPYPVIGVYRLKNRNEAKKYGTIKLNHKDQIIDFVEKPQKPESFLVSMCIYYFPKNSLKFIKDYVKKGLSSDHLGCYIKWLIKETKVFGFVFKGNWFDIGDYQIYTKLKKIYEEECKNEEKENLSSYCRVCS